MNHEEAMKRRWFQCWDYPASPKKYLSEQHRLQKIENQKKWYKKWGKDILKEAKEYVKTFEKLSEKEREILKACSFTYEHALEIIEEAKGEMK